MHSVNDQRLFFRAGRLYERLGGIDDAIGLYRKALAIDAEFDDAATRLAQLLFRRAKGDEAVALLDGVLKRNPQDPTALQNLGLVFRSTGHYAKALNAFQSSHKLAPEREILRVEVANCLINLGRAREGGALLKGMLETPQGRRVGASGYLMALLYDPTLKPSFICEEHLRLTADWPSLGRKNVRRKHGQRKSGRRRALRVGYLTADFFGNHPVAQFIAPLIKAHADEKYGIHTIAYDAHPRHDATASTMSSLCDVRNLSGLDDEAAAELIKKDDLDLLVDLSGHTSGRRLPMLGLRLAPAQACFIGYPSTTGFADVDYLIADEKVVPAGHDDLYSEKIARLPESFLCFRPPPKMPTPNKKHKDEIVFGSLNQLPKINAALLDVWAEIMEQTPKSRLLMQCAAFAEAETVTAIKSRMENSGIDAARLRLLGPQSFMQAMARYDEIDIALDPFPYNGGTTTCHALWMGTPVITLAGKYFCGRMGVSILAATKRADWIASDPTEYIEKAVTLASAHP